MEIVHTKLASNAEASDVNPETNGFIQKNIYKHTYHFTLRIIITLKIKAMHILFISGRTYLKYLLLVFSKVCCLYECVVCIE